MIKFDQTLINLVAYIVFGLFGALISYASWRSNDRHDTEEDAAWKATVDATLKNVDEKTQRILDTLDKSDARIGELEKDVAGLKRDVKTLFNKFDEREKK